MQEKIVVLRLQFLKTGIFIIKVKNVYHIFMVGLSEIDLLN